jgi:hypothetical protein
MQVVALSASTSAGSEASRQQLIAVLMVNGP